MPHSPLTVARPSLALHNVSMQFDGQAALQEVSLRCAPGEFVSLLGPSGCGKSTLLRLVARLAQPTAGEVEMPREVRTGFVFQDPTLLAWRTVFGNIALPFELQAERPVRTGRSQRRQKIKDALHLVGLDPLDAQKFPRQLSGGMRMRASLARALVTEPQVMLFDEPFAALDEILRQQLNESLLELWNVQRWTTLFVTHNVVEAVFLSQRIVIFSARPGRVAAEIAVPWDYPRSPELRGASEFAELVSDVSQRLREAA